ncbi:hypothetical protein BDR26DRAFT_891904 [Obelidium mucronatum]|nr:hypothetical protein BDR26DRAFT_891904 [Obelidium mucronatum]
MDLASSRPSFDSEASTGSRNSTSESKKEIPRVSPLLEGHSGEVTFLKVLRKDTSSGPPASTLSPLSAALGESGTYSFLVISSGVDSVVNVWEVYVMKPKPQQHVMSIHSSTLLKTVSQPGCVVATCFENMLVGARRKRSGACQKEQESGSSGLRNRRKDREESFGWWEVWVLDLTGLYSAGFQASSVHSEDGLVFVNIGEDNLSGIVLDSAATGFLARKERRLKRALAIIERRRIDESDASASEDSSDDEWVDNQSTESADRGCSTIIGDDSLVSLLPVFGINLLAASKWGVVCGFGNFLKVVYLDLSSPELKRVSSGMFSKQV